MVDGKEFAVESVINYPYLDQGNEMIDGFMVRVRLIDFDEIRSFKIKSDDPELIKAKCLEIVTKRKQIAVLEG